VIKKVDGVIAEPPPEAFVVDLGEADAGVVKLRLTWWTKSSRQHQLVASHDRVLTAISQELSRLAADRSSDRSPDRSNAQKPHAA
jgi:hypothetical protein